MKRMSDWLVMKSPAKLAQEKAEALEKAARASRAAAKASEQGRLDMQERAVQLKQAGDELLALLRQSQELSADGVSRVGDDVQEVHRKVDVMHGLLAGEFMAALADPRGHEELREALQAVQSVNLVGQDLRTLSKEFDALREVVMNVVEREQPPGPGYAARHRKTGGGEDRQEITGAGPGEAGPGPDEEARWLW